MKFDVNLVRHKIRLLWKGFQNDNYQYFERIAYLQNIFYITSIQYYNYNFHSEIFRTHNLIVFKLSYFLLQFIFDLNKQPCLSVSIHSFLLFYNLHYAIQLNKRSAVYFIRHYHWHKSLRKLIALLSNPSATTFEKLNNAYLALGCINLTMHSA